MNTTWTTTFRASGEVAEGVGAGVGYLVLAGLVVLVVAALCGGVHRAAAGLDVEAGVAWAEREDAALGEVLVALVGWVAGGDAVQGEGAVVDGELVQAQPDLEAGVEVEVAGAEGEGAGGMVAAEDDVGRGTAGEEEATATIRGRGTTTITDTL